MSKFLTPSTDLSIRYWFKLSLKRQRRTGLSNSQGLIATSLASWQYAWRPYRDVYWDGQTSLFAISALAFLQLIKSLSRSCIISNQPPAGRVCGNWKDGNRVDARFFPEHGQTAVYDRFPGTGRLAWQRRGSSPGVCVSSKIDARTARDLFGFGASRPLRGERRWRGKEISRSSVRVDLAIPSTLSTPVPPPRLQAVLIMLPHASMS